MRTFLLFLHSFRGRDDWASVSTHRHPLAYALSYALSSLPYLRSQLRWLALVRDEPVVRDAVRHDHRLLERWQHRYLSRGFTRGERLVRVYDHFRFVATPLPASPLSFPYAQGTLPPSPSLSVVGGGSVLAREPTRRPAPLRAR